MNLYIITKDNLRLPKGTVVSQFFGHTYGLIKKNNIAVIPYDKKKKSKHKSFVEIPIDSLDDYKDNSSTLK